MKKQTDILAHYPDILCQGQLCEAAHISKRRARYLLDKGLIPNVHSPNRRLGYKIKKEDVRIFLRELKENPDLYVLPASARPRKPASPKLLEAYYLAQLGSCPDILDAGQVMELTGYGTTAVHHWLSSGKLKSFLCGNKRRIPKKFLLTFLLSKAYSEIPHKSRKHQTALRKCRGKEAAHLPTIHLSKKAGKKKKSLGKNKRLAKSPLKKIKFSEKLP